MDRRDFLKTAGMGGIAFLAGCNAHPERHLYTLVHAPDDMVTGEALWYASTCRECPAGCGVLAKNRESRAIKVEGNPLHPINRGKLCARGQAALQHLYTPDRITTPLIKKAGRHQPISYDDAITVLQNKMHTAAVEGAKGMAMLSEVAGDDMAALLSGMMSRFGSPGPLFFEPLAYESLKFAHKQIFGRSILPDYRLEQADALVGFGADFLETWLSPVHYARRFKAMHGVKGDKKGVFCHISPYQSLTAANADQWFCCRPGSEVFVALGIMRLLLGQGRDGSSTKGASLPADTLAALGRLADPYSPEKVAALTEVAAGDLTRIARLLSRARRPLVLPTGAVGSGETSLAADLAVVWLNVLLDARLPLYDFDRRHRVETAADRQTVNDFWRRLQAQPVDLLFLNQVNPLHAIAGDIPVADVIAGPAVFTVAISSVMNETTTAADLVLPVRHALLNWDVYDGLSGVESMLQPTMGQIDSADQVPMPGDLFLRLWPAADRPANHYRDFLFQRLRDRRIITGQDDWLALVQRGGYFAEGPPPGQPPEILPSGADALKLALAALKPPGNDGLTLQVVPSLRMYDGRNADESWLQEIPEPVTQVAWQSPAMIHPSLMADRGWKPGQLVTLTTAWGSVRLPAYEHPGLHPGVIAVAMGQGHTHMGRYARFQGGNPLAMLSAAVDLRSGAPGFATAVTAAADDRCLTLASTSGSRLQHGRKIAMSIALSDLRPPGGRSGPAPGLTMFDFPLTFPLPEGYAHQRDIYPAHPHEGYRWGMAVDLDRCIGCSACVAACYAENNVGVVGEKQIINGREMAWLRIERYQDPDDPTRLIFLPMMCQHCDDAPCESVCPVFAPHHNKEGLNNQIYNRCIGTRFCAQNCPYKVRRFNWFDWQWPAPLNLQLNPNVTVRSKGVMEKCSFCVQRIKTAHSTAKNENRKIRDGEMVPACAQTCPTDALVFGDWMDPQSRLRKMVDDPRTYQVLGYLNTKPAVVYLRKVIQVV